MNLIHAEKRAEAKAARKARDHALYQSAGLLIMAGLVNEAAVGCKSMCDRISIFLNYPIIG